MLRLWMDDPHRATRDLDFLSRGALDAELIKIAIVDVCRTPCPEDGVIFEDKSLEFSPIQSEDEYQGVRAVFHAELAKARIKMQVDVGVGDSLATEPEQHTYPTMLDGLPVPSLRVYSRESSLAEKFEATIHLGRRNSRMKDFHDIWALTTHFSFAGESTLQSVRACLTRRQAAWPNPPADALNSDFWKDEFLSNQWRHYLRAEGFLTPPPPTLDIIGARIRAFFEPMRKADEVGVAFDLLWPPGGPWAPA